MDRDKALPLVYKAVFSGGGIDEPFDVDVYNHSTGLCEGAARQQQADWERVKLLVEALEAIWDEFDPAAMTPVGRQARDVLHQLGVEVKP